MTSDVTDELDEIGAALAAAGDGEPVELTDQQREVLARTTVPDTLDAILAHLTLPGGFVPRSLGGGTVHADKIAAAWFDELREAFRLQTITDQITEDDSFQTIQSIISQDERLSTAESQKLLHYVLPDQEGLDEEGLDEAFRIRRQHSTSSGSAPTRLLIPQPQPRAYLASISVEGFRGIGPRANLPLDPQRGLTLIYGANGSGKSTFVEALDVLLTGDTARFAGRGSEWRSAWANAHMPNRGQIAAEFVVEDRDVRYDTIQRDWTAADLSAATPKRHDSRWQAVQTIGELDVAGAIDEFRPILGYGESGLLFEENGPLDHSQSAHVTQFARQIGVRANIKDGITDALWDEISGFVNYQDEFFAVLSAWFEVFEYSRYDRNNIARGSLIGGKKASVVYDLVMDTMWHSPADWDWMMFTTEYEELASDPDQRFRNRLLELRKSLGEVARAYWPRFADQVADEIRKFIAQSRVDHRQWSGQWDGEYELVVYGKDGLGEAETFLASYAPRTRPYAAMLFKEINDVRLKQFSQRVSDFWQKIQRGSNVRFGALSLQQHRRTRTSDRDTPVRELRVALELTIDGDRAIERGALSQGELHSLALSIFLPTLMNPESPFGFAVIDDPVQAMDKHAVDGLAEVLRDAAKDLQLIVFTHDKRLLEALRRQGIDHTQINVTRTGGSVVTCERVSDPVSQRIDDARMFAEEAAADDEFRHRRNAAYQCRRAIEAACHGAVRSKFARQGFSHQQIENKVEHVLRNKDATTLRLLALAIFEDVGKQGAVRRHMRDRPGEWGEQQEIDTLAQVNALVHAVDLEAAVQSIVQAEHNRHHQAPDAERAEREAHAEREARAAFGRDPRDLVEDVEWLVKAIERNCA